MMWDIGGGASIPRSGPNTPYQAPPYAGSSSFPMPQPGPTPFGPIGAPSSTPNLLPPTPYYSPDPWGYPGQPASAPPPPIQHQRAPVATSHAHHHAQSYGRAPAVLHHPHPPPPVDHIHHSNCTGKRKALCIGINYPGQQFELYGCVNDAQNVRNFLIRHHNYRPEDIVMLIDSSHQARDQPTRKNILDAMRWLVKDARPNDALFFHYSGHGGQIKDKDGDEVDGYDEVIFPVDYKTAGCIVDDMMHAIMVKPLPENCRLTALFDSCHSGSILDLPYLYHTNGREKGSQVKAKHRKAKGTLADVISWSGCKDGQTSADTFENGKATGAMSYAFMSTLRHNPNQTYQQLLRSVREILKNKYSQKPQLSSSHPINTNEKFIM